MGLRERRWVFFRRVEFVIETGLGFVFLQRRPCRSIAWVYEKVAAAPFAGDRRPVKNPFLLSFEHDLMLPDHFTHVDEGIAHAAQGGVDAHLSMLGDVFEAHAQIRAHDHHFALFFR